MTTFIKLTRINSIENEEIWVSKYQIVYMEEDQRYSQTYLFTTLGEIIVAENITEIIAKF